MMKKTTLTLTLFLFSVITFSQARIPVNDPPPGGNTKPTSNPAPTANTNTASAELVKYSDPQGRFTIGYPKAWTLNDKPDNAIIQITSPKESDEDNFRQNLNLQIETVSSSTTVDQYVKSNMDGVKDAIKDYREVSSMYFNRNGSRAFEVVYKGKYGSITYDIQIKQLFTIVNSKAYILTYVSRVDERDAFETTANKIFNSLKY